MTHHPSRDRWTLAGFVLLAFLGCLVFLRVSGMYVSPDETANAFFSREFAFHQTLRAFEPLNVAFGDALHPRSVISLHGNLVPGSFVGLPVLYGLVGLAVGDWVLPLLTPLLAGLAVFAWYEIVSKLYDREVGLLSAILLAVHPAWWYYSARSFMHNVLFVALVVFAAYALVVRPFASRVKRPWVDAILSGFLLGLALFVRPSELCWLALAGFVAAAWYWKRRSGRHIALFFTGLVVGLLPLFGFNQAVYGSPFATGYTVSEAETASQDSGTGAVEGDSSVDPSSDNFVVRSFSFLFPFGLSARDTYRNLFAYGFGLFWWMTLLAIVGVPLALVRRGVSKDVRRTRVAYAAYAIAACAYLAALYGSWTFADNPDPSQITIGNSHVRYWLPAFVLSTPFAAQAIRWISRRAFTQTARRIALATLLVGCGVLSVRAVFFPAQDGLVASAQTLVESKETRTRALALTEPDAVIVVDRADKLFFPYRRVLYPLRDERTYALMPRLLLRVPVYYYGITFPQADLDYLNGDKLAAMGLRIDLVETFGIETLYRITRVEP